MNQEPILERQYIANFIKKEAIIKNFNNGNLEDKQFVDTNNFDTYEPLKDTKFFIGRANFSNKFLSEALNNLYTNFSNSLSESIAEIEKDNLELLEKKKDIELTNNDLVKLKKHISIYWNPPIGAISDGIVVDISMALDRDGNAFKTEWVNRGLNSNNTIYRATANSAIRAIKDAEPLPLPISKYESWRTLIFRFDTKSFVQ